MSGSIEISSGSESDLQSAVANVGPVSVAVDGSNNAFRVSCVCVCVCVCVWKFIDKALSHSLTFTHSLSLSLSLSVSTIQVEYTAHRGATVTAQS